MPRLARAPLAALAVLPFVASCGGSDDDRLTIYSGRTEELIGPLLDQFAEESGIKIDVLYGDSGDVALQIDAEGDETPADVFFSQAPGPLGFLDVDGRFQPLPDTILDQVDAQYRADDGEWVGVSARARVLAYDPSRTPEGTLPASVLDLTDPRYAGRVGVAPPNASFQDWVGALRTEIGDDETQAFLDGLVANDVQSYPNNIAVIDAVDRGEIDFGLVNHYYVLELQQQDPDLAVENHFFPADDPGSLVLVSGVAVLDTTDHAEEAAELIEFLLSPEAQQYMAEQTREFPLAGGVQPVDGLPPLADVAAASVDLSNLGEAFSTTRQMIEDAGLRG